MDVDGTTIAAILSVVVGGASGWVTSRASKKKISAEAESVSIASMERVIMSLNDEVGRLKEELVTQRDRRTLLEKRVRKLERWIRLQHPQIDPANDINGDEPKGAPV
jgi:predicted RNase H-like nuclease (RuvC/YqgF family)